MKNRKIISAITALAMATAGSGMSVMAAETPVATQAATKAAATQAATKAAATQAATKAAATKAVTTQAVTQPATQAPTKAPLTAAQIIGVWEGEYSGTLNSSVVKRAIRVIVTECGEDGKFKGCASVTSTPGMQYKLKGSVDFETGDMEFIGTDWLVNLNNFGFAGFAGSIDYSKKEYSGLIDDEEDRDFCLKKTEDTVPFILDSAAVSREWYGEYDGSSGSVTVRRNIKISISEISETGHVKGMAIFSPSDKSEAQYALDGSYYLEGEYYPEYGFIKMQGNEWIDKPDTDFDFIELFGNVSDGVIDGVTENGIWSMTSTKIIKGDLNFDNKIDVADLVIMQRYLLADFDFNKSLFYYADMNNDGNVDAFDLVFLRKELIENWL